jgi:hypothetical protein
MEAIRYSETSANSIRLHCVTKPQVSHSFLAFVIICLFVIGICKNLTSYPKGTGALSPGVKRPGLEADYSPPVIVIFIVIVSGAVLSP